jgi:hypothetical protein
MELQKLKELRKRAQQATSDMPDGELKMKAFEVILNNLLRGREDEPEAESALPGGVNARKRTAAVRSVPTTTRERILVLKAEDFLAKLRTIGEVREQLASRGWHYPLTSLSGPLQRLVQDGELRRQRVSDGGTKVWKYSNP